jgi:predicted transcriptional regulator
LNSKQERTSNEDLSLREVNHHLKIIIQKLDDIIEKIDTTKSKPRRIEDELDLTNLPMDVATLLSLTDHLRKTALTLCNLGESTADMIARETGRARAAESDYLNQLVSQGYVKKKRVGRKVYFYI